ncbi:hypothetical protein ACWGK7_03410 [Sphingomonas aurantiaca]
MIVVNPPPMPQSVPGLVSLSPEERALELALQLARVDYSCSQNTDSATWLRVLRDHGARTSFVVHGKRSFAYAVLRKDEMSSTEYDKHFIMDGLAGVVEAATMIAHCAKI